MLDIPNQFVHVNNESMSDLLASVKRSFYHEVLSYSDAEQRLEGKNGGYLFRKSNVKPGMFVLSYVK